MKNLKSILAAPAVLAILSVGCTPPQAQFKPASEPTILVKASPSVVMPVLQREVTAAYSGCEITQIDGNRLRVITSKSQGAAGTASTLYTLVPQGADGTLIKVSLLAVTPQGAMALPWMDQSKELFLKTGILDQTKAGAEAPKS